MPKGGHKMNHHFKTSQRLQKYLIDIIKSALSSSTTNSVEINTNLDCNVPEKDIHKIAGPFIDEWTYEIFNRASSTHTSIKSVTSKESSSLEDIYISLELDGITYDILIDVKSASLAKGNNAGKGSNLTSFRKIRPFYINNPDAFFFILSIEHQSIINNNKCYGFHLVDCNIFDLKYVSENELKFNTAMGDQFQISNSMKVTQTERTTDEFVALIDKMFLNKYSQDKLDKLIATEETNRLTTLISEDIISILCENEPLTKTNILSYLKALYPDISTSQLDKSIKLLKDSNRIQTINRRDYVIVK